MDAEGSECAIIKGAKKLIERSPWLKIIMEWNIQMIRKSGQDAEECLHYLVQQGFEFHIINT